MISERVETKILNRTMMVYVDNFNAKYGRMIMCHMIADTQEELLEMADTIGVQRKWVQDFGTAREHFDISVGKKKLAIDNGAKEIGFRELAEMTSKRQTPKDLYYYADRQPTERP